MNAIWMPGGMGMSKAEYLRTINQVTVNAVFDGIDTLEIKDLEDIKNIVDKRIGVLNINPKELEENNIMW